MPSACARDVASHGCRDAIPRHQHCALLDQQIAHLEQHQRRFPAAIHQPYVKGEQYLTRVFEKTFEAGEKVVTATLAETVLSPRIERSRAEAYPLRKQCGVGRRVVTLGRLSV